MKEGGVVAGFDFVGVILELAGGGEEEVVAVGGGELKEIRFGEVAGLPPEERSDDREQEEQACERPNQMFAEPFQGIRRACTRRQEGSTQKLGIGCEGRNCYYADMIIEIPDQDMGMVRLTTAEAKLEFAIGLYSGGHVTLGQGAKVADVPYATFMHELGRRGICASYGATEAREDIETVRKLALRPEPG